MTADSEIGSAATGPDNRGQLSAVRARPAKRARAPVEDGAFRIGRWGPSGRLQLSTTDLARGVQR